MKKQMFLRDKFGLNQEQLAQWLGISRSHLANYEQSRRKLSRDASTKHTQMLILMAKMETAAAKTGNERKPHPETLYRLKHAKKEIEYQREVAVYKAARMKEDLKAIQKQYIQTRDLMELLEMLMKTLNKEKDKADFSWLRGQYVNAEKQLLKCDEAAQLKMQAKLILLEAAANAKL